MRRHLLPTMLLALVACTTREDSAQRAADTAAGTDTAAGATYRAVDTPEAKIASAMSAAPQAIAAGATIMDWPASEGAEPVQLRAGTNGWVCLPSTPQAAGASGEDPMCLDEQFQDWATAWSSRKAPSVAAIGIAYMLRGDRGVSNTDPYAKAPTADNQWVRTGPHIMIVTPDVALIESLPTDPKTGGPYVMWKGTPHAHVMVPVQ
jgi:hypothetical protein